MARAVTLRRTLVTGLVLVVGSAAASWFLLSRAQALSAEATAALDAATQRADAARAQAAGFEPAMAVATSVVASREVTVAALIPPIARPPEELLLRAAAWAKAAGLDGFREALPEGDGSKDELDRLRIQLEGQTAPARPVNTSPDVTITVEFESDVKGLIRFLEVIRTQTAWVEVSKLEIGGGPKPLMRMSLLFHYLKPETPKP